MKPYYEQDGITIWNCDCREILPSITADVIVTDPPYGIGVTTMTLGKGKRRFHRGGWDGSRPDVGFLLDMAPKVCIWGGNYFADQLPVTNDWLCWHKKNDGRSFSEFELAWTNFGRQTRLFSHHWGGEEKNHPTQKPIVLMRWCLAEGDVQSTDVVVDPYMGSGTTIRAAKDFGCRAIGIEIEERYCEYAAQRLQQSVLPLGLAS